ncbi:MAG: tetratricopeptide repeat protein [Spirochaetaceae bacterium]|jgi:tetratricopeptide (TPR) repeat protein|nr:tetratricopeptide repeat protein [Spirochaetaceae bacterium]
MNALTVPNTLSRVASFLEHDNYAEAERLLKDALVLFPDNESLIKPLIRLYRMQGKLQVALDTLTCAVDADPLCAYFYYELGNINAQAGHYNAALMAYAKSVELAPTYVPAYNNFGIVAYNRGEEAKASIVFQDGLEVDPHNALLCYNYGAALEESGNLDEAANKYYKALEAREGWSAPLNNLGLIAYRRKNFEEAERLFTDLIHANPSEVDAHNNRGLVYAAQGKIKEAQEEYRYALKLNPQYIQAVLNLRVALEKEGNTSEAIRELEQAITRVPDNLDLKIQLASAYNQEGRYADALAQIQTVLNTEPHYKPALNAAAEAYLGLGNDDKAEALFKEMLLLDPNQHSIYLKLADIQHKKKKYKATEEQLKAYLAFRPQERGARLLLGTLYNEMWNLALAIQIFEDLLALSPDDADIIAILTKLYTDTGAEEELQTLKARSRPADPALVKDLWARALKQNLDQENKEESVWFGRTGMIMMSEIDAPAGASESEAEPKQEAEAQVPSTEVQKAALIISGYKISGLLRYLLEMVDNLPPKGLEIFKNSDAARSMSMIINVLEKRKGLLRNIQTKKYLREIEKFDTDKT